MLQQSERRQGRNAEGDDMFLFPNEGWASKLPKDPKALDRSQLAAVSGCCVFTWQNDDEASRVESSSKWSARPSARLSALRGPSARLSVLRGLAAVWLLSKTPIGGKLPDG